MKHNTKKWLAIAASLIILGAIIFVLTACSSNWNFKGIGSDKYETNTYKVSGEFDKISISSSDANITFVATEDNDIKVVAYEHKREKHSVSVTNGALTVSSVNEKKWFDHALNMTSPALTVYIPNGAYDSLVIKGSTGDVLLPKDYSFATVDIAMSTGDVNCFANAAKTLKIHLSTGDITVSDVNAGNVDLKVSTGKTYIKNLICQSFTSVGDTGDFYLESTTASDGFNVERSTGDTDIEALTTKDVTITASTGDVEIDTLTANNVTVRTSTGKIELDSANCVGEVKIAVSSGNSELKNVNCKSLVSTGDSGDLSLTAVIAAETYSITRSTGDIDFKECNAEDITIKTDTGDVEGSFLTDKIFIYRTDTGSVNLPETVTGGTCRITTDTGDIDISIVEVKPY